jgi:hypothetical protein
LSRVKDLLSQIAQIETHNNKAQALVNRMAPSLLTGACRATHIVWVETGTALRKDIADIESELIEILNPRGNTLLPKPPKEAHDLTIDVIECFRKEINRIRFQKNSR